MAMVAGRYGSHHTLHELRDLSGCGRDGMTLFHMRQLSENLGFDAKVYRAGGRTSTCASAGNRFLVR